MVSVNTIFSFSDLKFVNEKKLFKNKMIFRFSHLHLGSFDCHNNFFTTDICSVAQLVLLQQ